MVNFKGSHGFKLDNVTWGRTYVVVRGADADLAQVDGEDGVGA